MTPDSLPLLINPGQEPEAPQMTLTQALPTQDEDLRKTQEDLEEEMVSTGMTNYLNRIQKAREKDRESTTDYGNALLKSWVPPMVRLIEEFTTKALSGGAGRRASSAEFIVMSNPTMAAYLTCKVVLDCLTKGAKLQAVAHQIGSLLEDDVRFSLFKKTEPLLYKKVKEEFKTNHYGYRKRVMVKVMERFPSLEWQPWSIKEKIQVGILLLDMLCSASNGAIVVATKYVSTRRSSQIVQASPAMEKRIAELISRESGLMPCYTPMVIPPIPWSAFRGGGYLGVPVLNEHTGRSERRINMPLVKARGRHYAAYREEWNQRGDQLDTVYQAVNALQETAWQVNRGVFDVIEEAWGLGMEIAKLPIRDPMPLPVKPVDIATNDESCRKWKQEAHKIYTFNMQLVSKRALISRVLQVANNYKGYKAIYFPYQLDFRGRAYAVPMFLNPQGCDAAKALIRFSEGKPLGTQGAADWLAIHGANLFGYDKVSFQERVKWTLTNTVKILQAAMKPLEYLWWTEADKPWQFLAFCIEWRSYMKEGLNFVSHLPIALDGSCNGLQHFSAMLRDEVGGKAVNLVPCEKPQDIYQAVADRVKERLAEDLLTNPYAQRWLSFGIDRKMTKRPVMVVPYGGTKFSCRSYVRTHVLERTTGQGAVPSPFPPKEAKKATSYLAKVVWDAIGDVVVSARSAMRYLQLLSRAAAKQELPVHWVSPSGFPVLQVYATRHSSLLESKVTNFRAQIVIAEDTETIDKKRQEQGISPNFVHSLDAAAMMFTVTAGLGQGLKDFAMIHDSYGTHACNTEIMAQCCRVAFVECVYATDVLKDFTEQVKGLLPDDTTDLPEMPEKGTLDLAQVLDSPFFFA